jgi:dTDP-4-amino-4,6-dideoxygalactose transaminase
MNSLRDAGVGSQVHYIPIPMMPYYQGAADMSDLPQSLAYYRQALSLPCFPQMSDADVAKVCAVLEVSLT